MENENQWYKKAWMLPVYIIGTITILAMIIKNISSDKINSDRNIEKNPNDIVQEIERPNQLTVQKIETQAVNKAEVPAEKPQGEKTGEAQIKQLISKQLEGTNNAGKAYLRKIEAIEQIDGGWGVFAEFNADDNFTANLRKEGIEIKMSDIYIALYTSGKDIRTASVTAYYPTVDKYGNTSDSVVYKTMLEKSEAGKVNWNADRYQLETDILPNVWETTWIHSGFQK